MKTIEIFVFAAQRTKQQIPKRLLSSQNIFCSKKKMKKKIEKKELKPTKHRQLFQVISLWFQCFSYDLWQMTYYPSMFLLRFQSSPFRQNTHWQKCVYEMDFALRLSSFFSLLFFLFFVHSLLFLSFYLPILFR